MLVLPLLSTGPVFRFDLAICRFSAGLLLGDGQRWNSVFAVGHSGRLGRMFRISHLTPDEVHTRTVIFHSVSSSRIGYVRDEATMKKVKAAAGDSIKGDIQEQDRQEFKDARNFVSGQCTKDTAKVKTVGTDPSSMNITFVPAPNSIPQDQQLNSAPILAPAPAPSPAPASTPAADPDAVANISRKLDVLLGKIEDLTTDSNDLKDKVATLKDKVATSEKLSEERDAEITVLKDRVAALERLSEEQDAAYEDIHGWLVTVRAFYWSLCTHQPDHLP